MAKKKMISYVVTAVTAVIFGLVILPLGSAFGADVTLVKIFSAEDKAAMMLDPQDITIHTNGVVVWSNGIEKEVKVEFKDGKKCADLVRTPDERFTLDTSKACFVTTYMPFGSTSSLVFPEAGEFEYRVVTEDNKMDTAGIIRVVK